MEDGGHCGCMIISTTHAFYILPNWGCESLASDDIISSLLVLYSQLWEYVDTNPSTSEKLAPTKVVEWMCGLSETVPIVLRHLNTGGVALLEEVRHSLGQGRVQATVCFLCIPFSLCSLLAVQLVECSVAAYLHAFLPGWALIPLEPSCQIIFLLWAALVMVFLSEQQKKKNN